MVLSIVLFSIFGILNIHPVIAQNDEVVQCGWENEINLLFYCRGFVEEINYKRGEYFCCQNYIYCFGSSWKYKYEFHSIVFFGCKMARVKPGIFGSYRKLKELDLSHLDLEVLLRQDLDHADHLEKLLLSHNKITEIPAAVFINAPQLTEVDFSFNQINLIDSMAFEDFSDNSSNLKILDLSNNQIETINDKMFARLNALNKLNLEFNSIEVIEMDAFVKNINLNSVYLRANKLKEFPCHSFVALTKLDLAYNLLTEFDGNCINSESFIDLNVENNQLCNFSMNNDYSNLRAASNELQWIFIGDNLTVMEIFNVSVNKIENIPEIFNWLSKSLKLLDVSNSYVGKLNISTFAKFENLEQLVLRNTSLSNIQYGTFHHQKKLRLLDISLNNLKKINFNVFGPSLKNLESFYLDGNGLTEIDGLMKFNFPNMSLLGMSKNNFGCEYLTKFVWQWSGVNFTKDAPSEVSHIEGIACNEIHSEHYDYKKPKMQVVAKNIEATTVAVHPMNFSGHNQINSEDRKLLIFVSVILSLMCIVLVAKNLIVLWMSRRRLGLCKNEQNISFHREHFTECDQESIQPLDTTVARVAD